MPGVLKNMANVRVHYMRKAEYAKDWRGRVKLYVGQEMTRLGWRVAPEAPKRVTLVAHVARTMDSGGLVRALKPCEDGLTPDRFVTTKRGVQHYVGCGMLDDDAEARGHQFVRDQVVDRARRGVQITVEIL